MEVASLAVTVIAAPKDGRYDPIVKAKLLEDVEDVAVIRTGAATRAAVVWMHQHATLAAAPSPGILLQSLDWAWERFQSAWLAGTAEMLAAEEQDVDPLSRYEPSAN